MTLVALNRETHAIDVVSRGRTEVVQPATRTPAFTKGPYELETPDDSPPLLIILELYVVAKAEDGSKSIDKYASSKISVGSLAEALLQDGVVEVSVDLEAAMEGASASITLSIEYSDSDLYESYYDPAADGDHASVGLGADPQLLPQGQDGAFPVSQNDGHGDDDEYEYYDEDGAGPQGGGPDNQQPPRPSSSPSTQQQQQPASVRRSASGRRSARSRSGRRSARSYKGTPRPRSAMSSIAEASTASREHLPLAPPPLAHYNLVSKTMVPLKEVFAYSAAGTTSSAAKDTAFARAVIYEASGLPLVGPDAAELPAAFVSLKTTKDEREGRSALASTRAARGSRRPAWGEALVAPFPAQLLESTADESLVVTITDSLTSSVLIKYLVPFSGLDPGSCYWLKLSSAGRSETLLVQLQIVPPPSLLGRRLSSSPNATVLRVRLGRLAPDPDRNAAFQVVATVVSSATSFWQRTATRLNSGADPILPWSNASGDGRGQLRGPLPASPSPLVASAFSVTAWNEELHIPVSHAVVTNPSGAIVLQIWRGPALARGIYDPEYFGHILIPLDHEVLAPLEEGASLAMNQVPVSVVAPPIPTGTGTPRAQSPPVLDLELTLASASAWGPLTPVGAAPIIGQVGAASGTARSNIPGLDLQPSKFIPPPDSYSDDPYPYSGDGGYSYYSQSPSPRAYSKTRSPDSRRKRKPKSSRARSGNTSRRKSSRRKKYADEDASSFDPLATTPHSGRKYPGGHVLGASAPNPYGGGGTPGVTQVSLAPDVAVLTDDIRRKQEMIDRLLTEVDEKAAGIKTLGSDVVNLRKENTMLRVQITELSSQLEERDADAMDNAEVRAIDSLDRDELVRRHVALSSKYTADLRRFQENQLRVEKLQNSIIKHNEREKEYLELEAAHTAQAAFVLQLQNENASVGKFKTVIEDQEAVIGRLEKLLATARERAAQPVPELPQLAPPRPPSSERSARKGSRSASAAEAEAESLRSRLSDANREIHALRNQLRSRPGPSPAVGGGGGGSSSAELIQLRFKVEDLQRTNSRLETDLQKVLSMAGQGDLDSEGFLLLMRAETAEARAESLEQQLIDNTREYGSQIARLKSQMALH